MVIVATVWVLPEVLLQEKVTPCALILPIACTRKGTDSVFISGFFFFFFLFFFFLDRNSDLPRRFAAIGSCEKLFHGTHAQCCTCIHAACGAVSSLKIKVN